MKNQKLVYGFHAISSFVRTNAKLISSIFIDEERQDQRLKNFLKSLDDKNIKYHFYNKQRLDKLLPNTKHQGVIALISQKNESFFAIEDIVEKDYKIDPLFLILDGIEDPHNLGACFRVADAMGVNAIISPKDNAVGINATVRNVACGATESVPFVNVTNLKRAIDYLKQNHFIIIGTEQETKNSLYKTDLNGPLALIMGSEGSGMRRLTRESCDLLISIPMMGSVESLNVSVATGICLSEIQRQRQLP